MIRIMLVDDHAAVRAGLQTVLEPEIDLVAVAATEGNEQLWPQFRRTSPDLVLLDYHLPGQSSLLICRRLKAMVPTPFVAFYSAYADATLSIPLRLAGADGLASKGAPASELFDVLRRVGRGEKVLPPVTRVCRSPCSGRCRRRIGSSPHCCSTAPQSRISQRCCRWTPPAQPSVSSACSGAWPADTRRAHD
jgi:DNA-binding NarL/FixJ family response regulator